MQQESGDPATVKVDTAKAEAAVEETKGAVAGFYDFIEKHAPKSLLPKIKELKALDVKNLEKTGIMVKVAADTAPAEKALTKLQIAAAEIERRGAIARPAPLPARRPQPGTRLLQLPRPGTQQRCARSRRPQRNTTLRRNTMPQLLDTAAKAQQTAADTVAAQVKSITDETRRSSRTRSRWKRVQWRRSTTASRTAICRRHSHRLAGLNTSPSSRISTHRSPLGLATSRH